MAEVPEHLLQRSAERRAALTGGEAPSTDVATSGASGDSAPAAAAAASAAPAKVVPTEPAFAEPVNKAAFERVEAIRKRRIPVGAMAVLVMLPLWGFLYIGAFGTRGGEAEVIDGSVVYGNNFASCHGATGAGGVGPKLSGGEAVLTFPDEADHESWVNLGSAASVGKGKPYGDPARVGGQHVATTGQMPGFGGKLSPEEITAVVEYERDGL